MGAVILHSDGRDIPDRHHWIVHHDDAVWLVNADPLHPHAAGEHQAVVGVELAELAVADGHVHLDAPAYLVIDVLLEEGEPALAAHTSGPLEGQIAAGPGTQVQDHSLRAEHVPGLLPADLLTGTRVSAVEDAGEIHVEDHIREIRDHPAVIRL